MVQILGAGQEGKPFPLSVAPYIGDPDATSLYLQIIKELIRSDKKVLWFGEASSLPGHLTNLLKDKPVSISHYPHVAALGYVAAALYFWLQLEYEKKPKNLAQRIFDEVERGPQDDSDGLPPWVTGEDDDDDDGGGFFPEKGAVKSQAAKPGKRNKPVNRIQLQLMI